MKSLRILAVSALALFAACTFRVDPDKHARVFFDEGRDMILSALKKQELGEAQLEQARAILARHEQTVPAEMAGVMRKERDLLRGITRGRTSAELAALEAELHKTHEQAVRVIGRMHEELAGAVGEPAWKAAMARIDKRLGRHYRD
jgi:hypothetical protein